MSTDQEMAIIGRMVMERKELDKRRAILSEEVSRIGTGLTELGRRLTQVGGHYITLTPTEIDLLEAAKLTQLLKELDEADKRFDQLGSSLKQAGL